MSAAKKASPKSVKVSRDKIKELWPTIKGVLQFAKAILPKKAKGFVDAFIVAVDMLLMAGEEE